MPYDAKAWKLAALLTLAAVCLMLLATYVGYRLGRPSQAQAPVSAMPAMQAQPTEALDVAGFTQAITGDWRSPNEQLLIRTDKGVIEFLRQTQSKTGEVQLDLYVAAPVRTVPAQKQLELETSEGLWVLNLIPGNRRAQLKITYPDQQHVLYE